MRKTRGIHTALIVLLFMAAALAGCGGGAAPEAAQPEAGGPAGASRPAEPAKAAEPAKPQEVKKIRVILPAGVSGEEDYYKNQAKAFTEKNPDIDLEIQFVPGEQYGNTVSLMFASNDAPDIIRMSGSFPTKMTISYEKGWIQPLDGFITDDFKKRFPKEFFTPSSGLYMDGKLFAIPYTEQMVPAFRPFYYNIDLLNRFGYKEPPKTWSELKEMAAKITKEGNGSVYGFTVNGKDTPHVPAIELYEAANGQYHDAHVTEGNIIYDSKTGKAAANNPPLQSAVKLLQEMNAAKIFMPGWESVDGRTMFTHFAAGKVAMMIGQFWYAGDILKLNPQLNMGISLVPLPDDGRKGYKAIYGAAEPYFGITSKSKHPQEAWRVIEFFSTKEFQEGWSAITNLPAVLWRDYNLPATTKQLLELASQDLRVAPYPGNKHKDGEALLSSVMAAAPKPDVKDIISMALVGNKEYDKLAKEYDEKLDQVIDKQLSELKAKGSDITRDALVAPNDWNPLENYLK